MSAERDEFVKVCTQMIRDLTPEGDMNVLLTEYFNGRTHAENMVYVGNIIHEFFERTGSETTLPVFEAATVQEEVLRANFLEVPAVAYVLSMIYNR